MALRELKAKAIAMRKAGASYSEIKDVIPVSKSSLHLWLQEFPLPTDQIATLIHGRVRQIERSRETKRKIREKRLKELKVRVLGELGSFTKRDLYIAGLFLYWGEGGKTSPGRTTISNTDPAMILFFIKWLELFGIKKDCLRIYLHLYSDMNISREIQFWSHTLDLPRTAFRKPYIKASKRSDLTYPQRFPHGTCNIIFENRDMFEYVYTALECIRERFAVSHHA